MRISGYDDIQRLARRMLPRMVFEFIDGGAGAEVTLRANRSAFDRVFFDPRSLVDVSHREISTTVLGQKVAFPVLLAPCGLVRLAHPGGELEAAKAAGAAGTVFCVSTGSSYSLEEIAEVATGPLWFQLYPWRSDEVVKRLIERAKAAHYSALVLTIDVPVVGNRERDVRNGASIPPQIRLDTILDGLTRPRWLYGFLRDHDITFANIRDLLSGTPGSIAAVVDRELTDPSVTWERFDRIRHLWEGPIAVKGILSPRDAVEAVRRGADAVYVSNHGGRQLDGSPATLDVLPAIVDAVGGRVEVLMDGGVRRGQDVVKARALGARACFIGRPWVHALGGGGAPLIEKMLELIRVDIDRTLALVGVPRIDDVGPSVVHAGGERLGGATVVGASASMTH